MKIALLQTREDFLPIFTSSLQAFLRHAFQREVAVVAGDQGQLAFRMNPALNVIYPEGMPALALDPLTAEFRFAPRLIVRLLQGFYCRFAVRWPLATRTSPVAFALKNAPEDLQSWVFLPGNHTIRAIDVARDVSIVFAKQGFDSRFFLRDAELRQAHPDLPVPQVMEIDREGGWYKEERITGLPLNRLGDPQSRQRAQEVAEKALEFLRVRSETHALSWAYSANLSDEIKAQLSALRDDLQPISGQLEHFLTLTSTAITTAPAFDLPLCQTHGDFQPANILYDAGSAKTWLIDWEYSAERSVFYDFLVFALQSRFVEGLRNRICALLTQAETDCAATPFGEDAPGPIAALVAIFLLEELHLKLLEVATEAITDKRSGLAVWLQETQPVLETLTVDLLEQARA